MYKNMAKNIFTYPFSMDEKKVKFLSISRIVGRPFDWYEKRRRKIKTAKASRRRNRN